MENPQTPDLLSVLAEYWKFITAIAGGLTATVLFYRKYCRGKYTKIKNWCSSAVQLPITIESIRQELEYEHGISLRQQIALMSGDVKSLGQILSNEIANRRSALQFATTPLLEFDINGKFVWANEALLELTECELPDVLGNNWRNFVSGQHRNSVMQGWSSAVLDGTNYKTKFKLVTEAVECWVLFNVACNKDAEGNVLGWLGKLRVIDDPAILTTNG